MNAREVFKHRFRLQDALSGRWLLDGQDVTAQVNELVAKDWVRIHYFCGGSCLRARVKLARRLLSC